jgi:hypothetical protein
MLFQGSIHYPVGKLVGLVIYIYQHFNFFNQQLINNDE